EIYNEFGRMALAYMCKHPRETAILMLKKAAYYWWYPTWYTCPRCREGTHLTPFHHPEKAIWFVAVLLGVAGGIARRRDWRNWLYLVGPMASFTGLYAIASVGSNARYRFPVECIVLGFAGAAVATVVGAFRGHTVTRAALNADSR
ncbi:MAG TPA: hypothetical protein HPP83_08905, partial [Candidatus Hydrogenedentes bacterium]|nr:hypothetical protein [Candidatus Hydrogenedentota bacterium]